MTSFRSSAACRIVRLEKQRLNESIAAGHYSCAPAVQRGSSRVFDEDDLVALYIYARLIDDGMPPRRAGHIACEVREHIERAGNPQDEVLRVKTVRGDNVTLAGDTTVETPRVITGALVLWRTSFDIQNIRRIVREEMEGEASILGEDEGD